MESGNLHFKPLYGVLSSDPLCYLLEIDNVKILLDCGWNEHFDPELLEPLREVASEVKYVLISFPDLEHMGALPYAMKHLGLEATVYTTIPNVRLGASYLYDAYLSRIASGEFDLFDLDDVDRAIRSCEALTSGQKLRMGISQTNVEIEIEPIKAGRIVGGAMWRIRRDPDVILYAVDFNHGSDELLSGAQFPIGIRKPTLLITDSFNFLQKDKRKRSVIKSNFLKQTLATLRQGGNVLIPVDCAGRVLEILLLLNRHWASEHLSYPVIFLSRVSSVVDFVSEHLEWLKNEVTDAFDRTRVNPLHFPNIKVMDNVDQVLNVQGPRVVIASSSSMEYGMARELFVKWSKVAENRILITDRGMIEDGLCRKLLEKPQSIRLRMQSMVDLQGKELQNWRTEKAQRELEESRRLLQEEENKALQEMTGENLENMDDGDDDNAAEQLDAENTRPTGLNRSNSTLGGELPTNPKPVSKAKRLLFTVSEPERHYNWGEYGLIDDELCVANQKEEAKEDTSPAQTSVVETSKASKAAEIAATKLGALVLSKSDVVEHPPQKSESWDEVVYIRCGIEYHEMEGRSNHTSIKHVIQAMAPRKVIVVHGPEDATKALVEFCEDIQAGYPESFVKAPLPNELIDITSDTNVYQLQLSKELHATERKTIADYQVSYVEGIIQVNADDASQSKRQKRSHRAPMLEPLAEDDTTAMLPALQQPPQFLSPLGGLRLVQLKAALSSNGFNTEFVDGKYLVYNESIYVFIPKTGNVQIDGPLCDDYFKIRSLIYSQFVVV